MNAPTERGLDIREKGAPVDGQPQRLDRRLFMQLLAFGGCADAVALGRALEAAGIAGAVYEDANDPSGAAVLTFSEDPSFFVSQLRPVLQKPPFAALAPKPEYTMLGRTYAGGFEANLEDWLIDKPRKTVTNPAWPWAVWYPLKRSGAFFRLSPEEQGQILREHGAIGRSFGESDLAHDMRLACFGLDKNDSDFVIGLIGRELFPLSACVQAMRRTQQTALYITHMGPFFVGKAVWQSAGR